jgi:hypothetical protein
MKNVFAFNTQKVSKLFKGQEAEDFIKAHRDNGTLDSILIFINEEEAIEAYKQYHLQTLHEAATDYTAISKYTLEEVLEILNS